MRKSLVLLALLSASAGAFAQSYSYTGTTQASTWAAASVKGVGSSTSAAFVSGNGGNYGTGSYPGSFGYVPQSGVTIGTGGENIAPGANTGIFGQSLANGNSWVSNTSTGGGSGEALAYGYFTQTVTQSGYQLNQNGVPQGEPWQNQSTQVGQANSAIEIGLGTGSNGSAWAKGFSFATFNANTGIGTQNNITTYDPSTGNYGPNAVSEYATSASSFSNAITKAGGSSGFTGSAFSLLPSIVGNPAGTNINTSAWVYSNGATGPGNPLVNLAPSNAVLTNPQQPF